ncbi:MAG: hypothetical protein H6574_10890 [Lewinellaceae bacterium]|nr:hypothetical protein [Saprospiraceae bacterium]MCB9331581.1 hypothetical protein [Lewinellaceae bacterium]
MKKVEILLPVFGLLSAGIAVYQFIDGRMWDSFLSVLFSVVFFAGGWVCFYRSKGQGR